MKKQIFISYSRKDSEFVEWLTTRLNNKGVSTWIDKAGISVGVEWDTKLVTALDESEFFLIVISPNSVSSKIVLDELHYALENEKEIFPVIIEDAKVPLRLGRVQYSDFRNDTTQGLHALYAALRKSDLLPEKPTAVGAKLIEAFTVSSEPGNMMWDGENLWVGTLSGKNIHKICGKINKTCGEISFKKTPTSLVWFENYVWVANDRGGITKIDGASLEIISSTSLGDLMSISDMVLYKNKLWITIDSHNALACFNTENMEADYYYELPVTPDKIIEHNDEFWITSFDDDAIVRIKIDPKDDDNSQMELYDEIENPSSIMINDGYLWIASYDENKLYQIELGTMELIKDIDVMEGPGALVWDGYRIWVANVDSNTLQQIDSESGKILSTVPVGNAPMHLLHNDSDLWISCYMGDIIQRYDIGY
jgi:YVTN family beta-propeller protein